MIQLKSINELYTRLNNLLFRIEGSSVKPQKTYEYLHQELTFVLRQLDKIRQQQQQEAEELIEGLGDNYFMYNHDHDRHD